MAKTASRQRKTEGRVMHEFAHGELKSGPGGKGGKVTNPKQAIAIALNEAGASKYGSDRENKRSFAKTAGKEARGETAQQAKEGRSPAWARGEDVKVHPRWVGRMRRASPPAQKGRAHPLTRWRCDQGRTL